jgi:hypothetical protein
MSEKSKGTALILSSIPVIGWFGFDKLYVGSMGLFIAQFVCSLLVVGLLFSFPYTIISCLSLFGMILLGTNGFLYPEISWTATTITDKVIAWTIIIFYLYLIITIMFIYLTSRTNQD